MIGAWFFARSPIYLHGLGLRSYFCQIFIALRERRVSSSVLEPDQGQGDRKPAMHKQLCQMR